MTANLNFVTPATLRPLTMAPDGSALVGGTDERYPLVDGIPLLLSDSGHLQASSESQAYYRERVSEYDRGIEAAFADRKSTRLNSSHANISYAVFCLKKK